MSILIDGVDVPVTTDANIDGGDVERVVFDGTVVWRKHLRWVGALNCKLTVTCNSVSTNSTFAVKKVVANFTMPMAPRRWRIRLYADPVGESTLIGSTSDMSAGVLKASITSGQTPHPQRYDTIDFNIIVEIEDLVTGEWENLTGVNMVAKKISVENPYADTTLNLEENVYMNDVYLG